MKTLKKFTRWLRTTSSSRDSVLFEDSRPRVVRPFQAPACVPTPSQGLRDVLLLAPAAAAGGATRSKHRNCSKHYHIRHRLSRKHNVAPFGRLSNGRPKGPCYGELLSQREEYVRFLKSTPSVVQVATTVEVPVKKQSKVGKRTRSSLKGRFVRSQIYFKTKTSETRQRTAEKRSQVPVHTVPIVHDFVIDGSNHTVYGRRDTKGLKLKLPSRCKQFSREEVRFKFQVCETCNSYIREQDDYVRHTYGCDYGYEHTVCQGKDQIEARYDRAIDRVEIAGHDFPIHVKTHGKLDKIPIPKESKYVKGRKEAWKARRRAKLST